MSCSHCGFACTTKGQNMTMKTYKLALSLAEDHGEIVSIGGGEPTVHPLFWEMLGLAIVNSEEDMPLWIATNGKKTADALKLASLAKRGVISCELSQDVYHEPIDERVVKAFQTPPRNGYYRTNDYRGVRNTTQYNDPIMAGRCDDGKEMCICEDMFVTPNGVIHQCGCKNSPIVGCVENGVKEGYEQGCYQYSS